MNKYRFAVAMAFAATAAAGARLGGDWWKSVDLGSSPSNRLVCVEHGITDQRIIAWLIGESSFSSRNAVSATNLWRKLAIARGSLAGETEISGRTDALASLTELDKAIGRIAASEAVASFPAAERNAMTSNIVALARFDAKEAADLGLTNVVDTAEIDTAEK